MNCVVITGSARGFGLCQAKKFKTLGYNVVISDVNESNLQNATSELEQINSENTKVVSVKCDVTKMEDIENLYITAKNAFGGVDIWVNNAGVNSPDKPVYLLTDKEIEFILNVTLKVQFMVQVLPLSICKSKDMARFTMWKGTAQMMQ